MRERPANGQYNRPAGKGTLKNEKSGVESTGHGIAMLSLRSCISPLNDFART